MGDKERTGNGSQCPGNKEGLRSRVMPTLPDKSTHHPAGAPATQKKGHSKIKRRREGTQDNFPNLPPGAQNAVKMEAPVS